MEPRYIKPTYDPFEIFNPPKSLLKDALKSLKQQAYEALKKIETLKSYNEPILVESPVNNWKQRHRHLLLLINTYTKRLYQLNKTGSYKMDQKTSENGRFINSDDLQFARQASLSGFYVGTLKRSSGRLYGLCPFHEEKHPSFVIYEATNSFYCFGCGTGGDVIDFVRKLNKVSFADAVRFIIGKM